MNILGLRFVDSVPHPPLNARHLEIPAVSKFYTITALLSPYYCACHGHVVTTTYCALEPICTALSTFRSYAWYWVS